ncbi:MAG: mevalonate kinase [Anaerolineales bacterium]
MSSASAPGKIILFGEHAVVYGRPALAVPVLQVHADVTTDFVTDSRIRTDFGGKDWRSRIFIEAPDIGLFSTLDALLSDQTPHPLAAVIINVFQFLGITTPPAIRIRVTSSIPVASGLGSGAAVSVALIRALASAVQRPLSDDQVNALAYEIEKLHHGTPSGIDNTVVAYAMPVYFVRGQPIETLRVGAPFTLVIGYTGVSAPTKESVGDVRKLWEADKPRWEKVFDQVGEIAQQARAAIETGNTSALGPLMDANHVLLQALTVSSAELDQLVLAAKAAGAEGAKLSGGGRGGNMIALVAPERAETVAAALRSAGAPSTITTTIQ